MTQLTKSQLAEIRTAVADYMRSEGCGCCGDRYEHEKAQARLGKLLRVRKFPDKSGYDFSKYRSKEK